MKFKTKMAIIRNITKKTKLSERYVVCKSSLSKTIGLMFSIKPKTLVFFFDKEQICPLHMFFVFYPIDVLFLNEKMVVVDQKENFKPFTLYMPKKKSKYIIELPKGTIKNSKTELGNKINIQ